MTTFVNFQPTQTQPFQFQATLDGTSYNVVVTWSLFGARFMANVFALDGTLVVSRALVGTDGGKQIQSLSWSAGVVTATTIAPHGWRVGRPVALTVAGASPSGYNGAFECTPNSDTEFTYNVATNPGGAMVFGSATFLVDLVGGLFSTSTMIYRAGTRQFEISP